MQEADGQEQAFWPQFAGDKLIFSSKVGCGGWI